MPRRPTGQVIPPAGKQRSYAIRFHAYGRRRFVTLGRPEDGWTYERAEAALRHTLADVERGTWQPPSKPEPQPSAAPEQPTFHAFASRWFDRHRAGWSDRTVEDYRWALSNHLLPFFAEYRLSEITVERVDAYKAAKLAAGTLSPASVNKTLTRLAQILSDAVEYGYLDRNPASGRRRRLKTRQPQRHWVEPEQLLVLLEAADAWHRPLLATLAGAGLRVGEACALNWRDVNLATGTLTVGDAKTDAGTGRQVDLPGGLVDELSELRARSARTRPSDPVFLCRPRVGRQSRQNKDNVSRRLKTTISRANKKLSRLSIEPISERVTPHSLRRTYASLRAAVGDDPVYIAEQLGHTDARFTFRVYQKAAKRRDKLSGAYLKAFDSAIDWAEIGRIAASAPSTRSRVKHTRATQRALESHN
jgi:integrase